MKNAVKPLNSYVESLEKRVKELETKDAQLELVIESTGVGIWDWYVQTGQTSFNERWANIIGYTLEEISPVSIDTWMKYAHPDDLEESGRLLQEHWEGKTEHYIFESRMKHKDGHWVWVYDTGKVTEWESEGVPKRMVGTHLDITEQRNTQQALYDANKELQRLIRIDPLAQIANRRSYDERLEYELSVVRRTRSPLTMLVLDIDHFKQFNDRYGHQKGDEAIRKIANKLKVSCCRRTDFVARFGGEEFVVLLPFTKADEAPTVCDKILKGIENLGIEHEDSGHQKALTVSIGVASTESSTDNLFKRADEALYAAKEQGRNQYYVYDD